ncbi:MAG: dienelactone hydrolase family protein [Planctomycetes bacterium]|nr:dienelactone hydrolase family protein [Planctomycetota bacterium]
MRMTRGVVMCVALMLVGAARAQEAITRDVLAWWYLEADRAWSAARTPEKVKDANSAFDRATLAFFRLGFADAIGELRGLRRSLTGAKAGEGFDPVLLMSVEPRVVREGAVKVRARSLVVRGDGQAESAKVLVRWSGGANWEKELELNARVGEAWAGETTIELAGARPGRWEIELVNHGEAQAHERVYGVEASLDQVRERYAKRLEALKGKEPLAESVAVCEQRNKLLTDAPSRNTSAQFMAEYDTLARRLEAELAALEAGKDPYPLEGVWWCAIPTKTGSVPCWVSGPVGTGEKVPLIIALHGAGGDENMFVSGYGQGAVMGRAARGCVVASPATMTLMSSDANFDALVERLCAWYPVDRSRVYVIGHSMGAGAASRLAARRSGTVAGVVCFSGGGMPKAGPMSPMLVIAGETDPLAPAARLRPGVEKAAADGMPVEFREKAGYGHTFVVGDYLEEAVAWLWEKRLAVK